MESGHAHSAAGDKVEEYGRDFNGRQVDPVSGDDAILVPQDGEIPIKAEGSGGHSCVPQIDGSTRWSCNNTESLLYLDKKKSVCTMYAMRLQQFECMEKFSTQLRTLEHALEPECVW